jgi:hypothetical protein
VEEDCAYLCLGVAQEALETRTERVICHLGPHYSADLGNLHRQRPSHSPGSVRSNGQHNGQHLAHLHRNKIMRGPLLDMQKGAGCRRGQGVRCTFSSTGMAAARAMQMPTVWMRTESCNNTQNTTSVDAIFMHTKCRNSLACTEWEAVCGKRA